MRCATRARRSRTRGSGTQIVGKRSSLKRHRMALPFPSHSSGGGIGSRADRTTESEAVLMTSVWPGEWRVINADRMARFLGMFRGIGTSLLAGGPSAPVRAVSADHLEGICHDVFPFPLVWQFRVGDPAG